MGRKRKRIVFAPIVISFSVALVLIAFLGGFHMLRQWRYAVSVREAMREEFVRDRREEMARQVDNLWTYALFRKASMRGEIEDSLRQQVGEAYAVVMGVHEEGKGILPKDRLRQVALESLRNVRFNEGRGYLFAVGLDGTELLYPVRPDLEGENLSDLTDATGEHVIRKEIELVLKEGEGFVEDYWEKPETPGIVSLKISFVKRVEPLDMYIGAGEYVDDYEASMKRDVLDRAAGMVPERHTGMAVADFGSDTVRHVVGLNTYETWPSFFLNRINRHQWESLLMAAEAQDGMFIQEELKGLSNEKPVPRLVFVRKIPGWQWSLVTWSDLEDMEIIMNQADVSMRDELKGQVVFLGVMSLFLLAMAFAIAHYFRGVVEEQIGHFEIFYKNATRRGTRVAVERIKYQELYELARDTNIMMESLWEIRSELEESEDKFRSFFELSPDCIYMIDYVEGRIQEANPAFLEKTGYSFDELRRMSFRELCLSGDLERAAEARKRIEANEKVKNLEMVLKTASGGAIHLEINACPVLKNGRVVRVLHIARDVTERRRSEERIKRLAFNDFLTGLPNRKSFLDGLENAVRKSIGNGESFGIAFIDLDRFKHINDTLGHTAGDRLLAAVATRLRTCIRSTDILARLGGDEFVILFKDVSGREGMERASVKILEILREPFVLDSLSVLVTASLGLAVYPEDGKDSERLLMNADKAMYAAKDLGRNTYKFYDSSIKEYGTDNLSLMADLSKAIEAGQFLLHYQPVTTCRKGRLIGAEALIRWNHPDKGLIYPDRFIYLAEENGQIVEIGSWVIREVAAKLGEMKRRGFDGIVGVNLSRIQLQGDGLLKVLKQAVEENGIRFDQFVLEITESLAFEEAERDRGLLDDLSRLGVHVALDDFGTGYSSLSQLHKYALNIVKVDKSFIAGAADKGRQRGVLASIVEMAHRFGLKVVAEGVETPGQLETLKEMGCDMVQGYHIARPMPFERFMEYWRSHM